MKSRESKFVEAYDSLESDEKIKQERKTRLLAEYRKMRVLNEYYARTPKPQPVRSVPPKPYPAPGRKRVSVECYDEEPAPQPMQATRARSEHAAKTRAPLGKRGIAILMAMIIFVAAIGIVVPVWLNLYNNSGLLGAMSQLKDTFVNMKGISAFGVWNAPDSASKSAYISGVTSIYQSSVNDEGEGGEISQGDWSDEVRYEWESDYDWDPTKANVLIAINEDGTISEVVYERTNGRGQVRQDVLGNAAKVYVSNGFTYVMYVDDQEWEFWKQINYAQEARSPGSFNCHHERQQTVVIHNATGKVFALNDIIPQVNELSGAINHTLCADPLKDDILHIRPMYGNYKHQWYNVRFDEATQKIKYELVIDKELVADKSYNVFAVSRDKYGQQYLLSRSNDYGQERVDAGIINLPKHNIYGNSLIFEERNGFYLGTDGQVYVFDNGVLKVYGDEFRLEPVSPGLEVSFEGIVDLYTGDSLVSTGSGISYTLKDGYLFSMFGEVWKVGDDGSLSKRDSLTGSFPRHADDAFLIGGEIIAFVDTKPLSILFEDQYSVNGRMVQLKFGVDGEGLPIVKIVHIIPASEMDCSGGRMMVQQNSGPYTAHRGDTKYFLITVADGTPIVEYVLWGHDGGVGGLIKPLIGPLVQS